MNSTDKIVGFGPMDAPIATLEGLMVAVQDRKNVSKFSRFGEVVFCTTRPKDVTSVEFGKRVPATMRMSKIGDIKIGWFTTVDENHKRRIWIWTA
jgi:hypothetical protein